LTPPPEVPIDPEPTDEEPAELPVEASDPSERKTTPEPDEPVEQDKELLSNLIHQLDGQTKIQIIAVTDSEEIASPDEILDYLDFLTSMATSEAKMRMIISSVSLEMIADPAEVRRLRSLTEFGVAFDPNYLWKQLEEIPLPSIMHDFRIVAGFTTIVGSIGYLFMSLRGGAIVALALSQHPTWTQIDPLPVLESYPSKNQTSESSDGLDHWFES